MNKYYIQIKRAYEQAEENDGYRVLIDRLWPRGISKEKAHIDEWDKNIAPSTELRNWYNHQEERYEEFKQKYIDELQTKNDDLKRLKKIANTQNLTLLYASKVPNINNANVLLEVLLSMK
ncbi:MAG TPA: DUF488 family protein [Chitinophagaceae bacterium]|nr:MAG: uroporphyrin-III C-methyltransferase [Bacteroidetes bacterium OLB11]HMN32869.1 DUF488 family protein [Chitinophagaceae bacterium]